MLRLRVGGLYLRIHPGLALVAAALFLVGRDAERTEAVAADLGVRAAGMVHSHVIDFDDMGAFASALDAAAEASLELGRAALEEHPGLRGWVERLPGAEPESATQTIHENTD